MWISQVVVGKNKTKHKHSFKALKRDTFLNNIAKMVVFMEAHKKLFNLVVNRLQIQAREFEPELGHITLWKLIMK